MLPKSFTAVFLTVTFKQFIQPPPKKIVVTRFLLLLFDLHVQPIVKSLTWVPGHEEVKTNV